MAKMNQEMYGATGKVGNKVYYRANGKTVAREVVTPKNPKTNLQTVQRVIAKQVGKTYQMFKSICDHSFEGVTMGAQSAAKFRKLNMRKLRERASELQQAGQSLNQFYNFMPISGEKWVPGAAIIAQGQLTKIVPTVGQDELGLYVGKLAIAENTYAGVIAATGAKRGDQLTFITVEKENGEYAVHKSRIILDPRNADGSGAPLSTAFITDNAVTSPSWKNDSKFTYLDYADGEVMFAHGGNGSTLVACGIIASRKVDNEWQRSNAELVISEAACGSDLCSLMTAVENSYQGSDVDLESDLYLNNAGEGGLQGETETAAPSAEPSYSNEVAINGVNQNIAGGSASATAPVNTIVITGSNLAEAPVTGRKSGTSVDVTPTKTANSITFDALALAAGESFVVKKDGATWFTVAAVAGGGGAPDFGDQG